MLRIITDIVEARIELRRIADRAAEGEIWLRPRETFEILNAVKNEGDRALVRYAETFDGRVLNTAQLRVSGSELDAAYQQVRAEFIDAIRLAGEKIEAFHRQRVPQSWVQFEADGVALGKRYTPVERAGLHIPGGRSAYPSTVLMNAIPAKVAGVPRVVMATPPGEGGKIDPAVLVAAQEAGVEEIYRVGGAVAIAALAYGTATIPKVDVVVGPGDAGAMLAKNWVGTTVRTDSLAWPPEIVIIADSGANPTHVAADLLAQAERDPLSAAILMTPDSFLAKTVRETVDRQLQDHPRRLPTEKAIAHYGLIIVVDSLAAAVELSNQLAPQQLGLQVGEPWDLLTSIRHAGAIYCGYDTPAAAATYLAGPNSMLPASGAARYASPLGVETFLKHSHLIEYSNAALDKVAGAIEILARAESLYSHNESLRWRQSGRDRH